MVVYESAFLHTASLSCDHYYGLSRWSLTTLQAERPFVFLSEEEKKRLYLNHVKPFKPPKPKLLA